ncbi:magnesium and cobalt transporter [Mycobacterium tuberculosis]|nr:magnesium and cobalt transporter [Mycobacterium tuberculosis]
MQDVADVFGLHPLAVEDAVHAHQRPKLERYDETLFLVLKTVNYVPHESVVLAREIVETGEIMIFVGKDFVVTVRHGEHGGLSEVRKRMDADPEHLRLGPYAVMHAIADYVVDHYLEVTNLMETDIDSIEEVAFAPGRKLDIEPIYLLKREVVELRRCVNPLSTAFQRMQTESKDLISKEVRRYLRDVADHQTEAADQIASYDDMLNSLVQAALARVGMQQNMDMRKISAWAGIIAVPTMIAGIYGMNFHFMPELDSRWGYPTVIGGWALSVCSSTTSSATETGSSFASANRRKKLQILRRGGGLCVRSPPLGAVRNGQVRTGVGVEDGKSGGIESQLDRLPDGYLGLGGNPCHELIFV